MREKRLDEIEECQRAAFDEVHRVSDRLHAIAPFVPDQALHTEIELLNDVEERLRKAGTLVREWKAEVEE